MIERSDALLIVACVTNPERKEWALNRLAPRPAARQYLCTTPLTVWALTAEAPRVLQLAARWEF